ncbi:LPXTG cell wall anchor domain-containing protein [Staphylococcus haemolyticus]|uniref:LPXTG cell wall anchor domain-containing protein n=1 Tax=Staphylococcus haemolyticus TaxID=1283 RepID=UPI0029297537|nr:LPXTG cell wall anchor domain-containing protein [Staphylococcus haemolyticus]MDU9360712.1 LPXTG cell wall anchor domain-containing protein [Staphylococcus haemolyticus]
MIKRRFKYAFGTTLVTSSLLLMSHGHAFAATNNIDQAFNHDNNGQPITSQDNNNNVDPGFNHDVDDNNDTDPGFNHDVINNNDATKHQAEDNDMGFNGYAEKHHLVKQQDQSPKSQMNSTLSKQATRSQETSQTSLHHELPMTGERASTTTFVYSFIAFILGVGVISLRRKFSK